MVRATFLCELCVSAEVMSMAKSRVVVRLVGLATLFDAVATWSLTSLSHTVVKACSALDSFPEPEEVAFACAEAIAVEGAGKADAVAEAIPPQGEYDFSDAELQSWDERYAVLEAPAYEGDSRAMQSLGLLYYGGIGGVPSADERFSAQWHAASAARGNLDALATLGGCIRRGVGAEQHEVLGVELVRAAAAAGSPVGLTKLGNLHDDGASGLAQDSWAAAQCFARAAEPGTSALGLFAHGWSLVYGIGSPRDVENGFAAWAAAAALAPDDGSEEAAFFLYDERSAMSAAQVKKYRPGAHLRLAASLGYETAVRELRRREKARELADIYTDGLKQKKERFIRNDKARAYTAREERGEAFLDS